MASDSARCATPAEPDDEASPTSSPLFREDDAMARVALVTGGTRGIGAAICRALAAQGTKVAANYGGNDDAAAKFKAETGIPTFKWDVGDYDASTAGVASVEAEV